MTNERANFLHIMDNVELDRFGRYVSDAFPEGYGPFLVGSVLHKPDYRDVDVRLILPDDEYERLLGPMTQPHYKNARWNAHVIAWTYFGQKITGLPIDFQIDQMTEANELYPTSGGFVRNALGIVNR